MAHVTEEQNQKFADYIEEHVPNVAALLIIIRNEDGSVDADILSRYPNAQIAPYVLQFGLELSSAPDQAAFTEGEEN